MTARLLLSDLKKLASAKHGTILLQTYGNNRTPLRVRCDKGHVWNSNGDKLKQGYWCPNCAGVIRGTLSEMCVIAKARGGRCLSKRYVNSSTKLEWICAKGHRWRALSSNVKFGSWCKICAGKEKDTIESMKVLAKSRGGMCLSQSYVNRNSKLKWQCSQKHVWWATPGNVKNSGSWCPECKAYLRERLCRRIFEEVFKNKFPPAWPKWLRNSRGNLMELDGYCSELGLAFEHHGKQHYKKNTLTMRSDKDLNKRKSDDRRKAQLCKRQGITLMVIPFSADLKEVPGIISRTLSSRKNQINTSFDFEKMSFVDIYSRHWIGELQDIAKNRGGALLSTKYLGIERPLRWKCAKGHIWLAAPNNIKNGRQWCPQCGRKSAGDKQRLTIEEMQKIAKARGGMCISKKYVNVMTKLKWRCKAGHVWWAIPQHVKNNKSWCPKCSVRKPKR